MLLEERYREIHAIHATATQENNQEKLFWCLQQYKELLNQAPDEMVLMFGIGTVEMQLGFNGAAMTWFKRCLAIKELPELWNNLGTALKNENHDDLARDCWVKALALREDPDYYNNMVTLYINTGMPREGLQWAEKGLSIAPDHARLHWNHSLLLLEQGNWREGFSEYDWGLASLDRPTREYTVTPGEIPFWDGGKGKRIVVYGEQGMGDEIMFASCLPDLMKDCEVVFDCHPRMVALFERSFGVKCYGTRKNATIGWVKDEKPFDARLAIGSLFKFYRSNGKFPKTAYLKPKRELVEYYREKLKAHGDGPYVGIGWQAGTKHTRSDFRSMKLKQFIPLIEQGGTFISLQYTEESGAKCDRFFNETGFRVHHWPEVIESGPREKRNSGYDFDHTVALIAALDLCVLPNTTAVHVCGAIGKECWTLTPKAAAWRYQLKGRQMPMYGPWVRQFRGDDSFEQIIKEYRHRWPRTQPAESAAG